MAMHEFLFPRFQDALRGIPVKAYYGGGGSRNYELMGYGADYVSTPNPLGCPSREPLLRILRNDKSVGHGTNRTAKQGIACEQGSPAAHRNFTYAPILGCYQRAATLRNGEQLDPEMAAACLAALYAETALCRDFSFRGRVLMPGARFKDDANKKMAGAQSQGVDPYADLFLYMALGNPPIKKGTAFWESPQSCFVRLARDVFADRRLWDPKLAADPVRNPLPKLYLPIVRRDLPDGGYLAWIERTPEAVKAMGGDGCNWVLAGPSAGPQEYRFGYDWAELPAIEE